MSALRSLAANQVLARPAFVVGRESDPAHVPANIGLSPFSTTLSSRELRALSTALRTWENSPDSTSKSAYVRRTSSRGTFLPFLRTSNRSISCPRPNLSLSTRRALLGDPKAEFRPCQASTSFVDFQRLLPDCFFVFSYTLLVSRTLGSSYTPLKRNQHFEFLERSSRWWENRAISFPLNAGGDLL
jgi:hypothetical protein